MPMIDPLYPYWAELAAHQDWNPEASDAMYQNVTGRYDQEWRHFHTRQHLQNIFKVLPLDHYAPDERAVLIATTFWHDAVYDTATPASAGMNEENSAILAHYDLKRLGSDKDFSAHVETIIRASKTHKCNADADPVGAMFLDCDMATLAGTWEQFCVGSDQIDAEFHAIPCDTYYKVRMQKFIDPLLNAPNIYLLEENEARWGVQARANLSQEKADIEKKMAALNGEACGVQPEKLQLK